MLQLLTDFLFIEKKEERRVIDSLKIENQKLKDELDKHKEFFDVVYHYCGGYPNWKAQQEYREIIRERSGDEFYQPTEPLDQFLGNVVDATKSLLQTCYSTEIPSRTNDYFWNDGLSQARGCDIQIKWSSQ